MDYLTQDDFAFSTLSNLALFYPFSSFAGNLTTVIIHHKLVLRLYLCFFSSKWIVNGASLLDVIISAYDPTDSLVQKCQLGLKNTKIFTNLISSYKAISIEQYLISLFKTKRIANTLQCNDLTDMGTQLSSLSLTYLSTITPSTLYECKALLGSINSWSYNQLATLATITKTV